MKALLGRYASAMPVRIVLLAVMAASCLSGCGGGESSTGQVVTQGQASFLDTGQPIYSTSKAADVNGALTIDSGKTGVRIVGDRGAFAPAARLSLTVSTSPHSASKVPGFEISANSVDITLDPATWNSGRPLRLELPNLGGATAGNSGVLAFEPSGRLIVLDDKASAGNVMIGFLSKSDVEYLYPQSHGPVVVSVAAFRQIPSSSKPKFVSSTAPLGGATPFKSYAHKKRVLVIVHGMRSKAADMGDMVSFFKSDTQTDDAENDARSKPFDQVEAFDYVWQDPIAENGAKFAQFLSAFKDSESQKFEVVIMAHSMGGLVSRFALEKAGVPGVNVRELITYGTPHNGVPKRIIKLIALFGHVYSATTPILPDLNNGGVTDLFEGSKFLTDLGQPKPPSGVVYHAIAGVDHEYVPVVQPLITWIYNSNNPPVTEFDGIVPVSSAIAGIASPAKVAFTHSGLVHSGLATEWPKDGSGPCSAWLKGVNRRVASMRVTPSSVTVYGNGGYGLYVNGPDTPLVEFLDKDGDVIDTSLEPNNWKHGAQGDYGVNPILVSSNDLAVAWPDTETFYDGSSATLWVGARGNWKYGAAELTFRPNASMQVEPGYHPQATVHFVRKRIGVHYRYTLTGIDPETGQMICGPVSPEFLTDDRDRTSVQGYEWLYHPITDFAVQDLEWSFENPVITTTYGAFSLGGDFAFTAPYVDIFYPRDRRMGTFQYKFLGQEDWPPEGVLPYAKAKSAPNLPTK